MKRSNTPQSEWKDISVPVNVKLAALWASFMFLYIYIDYFHLYMPRALQDMLVGKVFVFEVSQGFLVAAFVSVSIPAVMISLSVFLQARVNRLTNLIVAVLYIPYTLFNLSGEAWVHMVVGAVIEVGLLLFIIRNAWKWPRVKSVESFEPLTYDDLLTCHR